MLRLSQMTATKLRDWLLELKKTNNYTDRNLNHIKSDLNHFFKYLIAEGFSHKNPLNSIKFSRKYTLKRPRVILTRQEIEEALDAMKEHSEVVYPYIYCVVHTGARREQVRLIEWEDIDFSTGLLRIKKAKRQGERTINMSASLSSFLQSLPRNGNYVFLNQRGTLVGRYQIDETIATLQKKYPSMKKWRCHDLRHSFAYNYFKKGGEVYALKAILGHKSIQLTVDLYGNFKACDVDMVDPYEG
jgi:integrase